MFKRSESALDSFLGIFSTGMSDKGWKRSLKSSFGSPSILTSLLSKDALLLMSLFEVLPAQ